MVGLSHGFHEAPLTVVVAHPSEPLLLSAAQDGSVRLCKLDSKRVIGAMSHAGLAAGAATSGGLAAPTASAAARRALGQDEDEVETMSVET